LRCRLKVKRSRGYGRLAACHRDRPKRPRPLVSRLRRVDRNAFGFASCLRQVGLSSALRKNEKRKTRENHPPFPGVGPHRPRLPGGALRGRGRRPWPWTVDRMLQRETTRQCASRRRRLGRSHSAATAVSNPRAHPAANPASPLLAWRRTPAPRRPSVNRQPSRSTVNRHGQRIRSRQRGLPLRKDESPRPSGAGTEPCRPRLPGGCRRNHDSINSGVSLG